MFQLHEVMDKTEYDDFVSKGYFTIRPADKFFSGTWSDMIIEQTANKDFKTKSGDVPRGFTESVITGHVVATPALSSICNTLVDFCNIDLSTSEQHVDLRESRFPEIMRTQKAL